VWHAFSVRPERVFDAFLDPDAIRAWFGPGEIIHIDVQAHVGGMFSIAQRRGDSVLDARGTFRKLDRPHRLVFSWTTSATPLPEGLVTIDIEPRDGGSAVTLTHQLGPSWAVQIAQVEASWTRMLDAMSEALGDQAADDR
jgi:uncharacterized protein YndB with AHSA1/START domain